MTNEFYTYRHTVTFAETNLVGNVYFAHYVMWQGKCREQFILDHAPSVVSALAAGELALVTLHLDVDFLEECYAGDEIEIKMRRVDTSIANTTRLAMSFEYSCGERVVAVGAQTVGCMKRGAAGDYRPCGVPAALAEALSEYACG